MPTQKAVQKWGPMMTHSAQGLKEARQTTATAFSEHTHTTLQIAPLLPYVTAGHASCALAQLILAATLWAM